jgi:hypothetical protein
MVTCTGVKKGHEEFLKISLVEGKLHKFEGHIVKLHQKIR